MYILKVHLLQGRSKQRHFEVALMRAHAAARRKGARHIYLRGQAPERIRRVLARIAGAAVAGVEQFVLTENRPTTPGKSGMGVVGLTAQTKSLEDIFLSLTQTSGEVA